MEVRPYAILPDIRAVRVVHIDLDKSWWQRATSFCEREMQDVETVLRQASGLQRLYRRHNRFWSYVEFRLNRHSFNAAACALRITYAADQYWERRLKEYPE